MLRALPRTALGSQTLRYLMVGGSMALLFALCVWLFHSAGLYGWASSLLSSGCVAVPTILLHRYFTFGVRGPFLKQAMGTLAVAAANVPMGALTILVLVDLLGWHPFLSSLIATVIASIFNYAVLSRVVFTRSPA